MTTRSANTKARWSATAISVQSLGRFRVNVFRQRGDVAMVIRFIKAEIPSIEELYLPQLLKKPIMERRGLILVVGSTGSGKSTTLASMIDYRNEHTTGHILSIEDPIEFLHSHKKSVVNQREIGLDSMSYENALKNALREAPDVILIGEIRDAATMQHAIAYAETGHLCLSTLHANNANQALDRIVNFFPDSAHKQILNDLSNLKAVVSQRLVPTIDNKRRAAVEMLIQTSYTAEPIQKGKIHDLKEAMEQGTQRGMQTFDQSLYELYEEGAISLEEALSHADSRNNLALRIRLNAGTANAQPRQSRPQGRRRRLAGPIRRSPAAPHGRRSAIMRAFNAQASSGREPLQSLPGRPAARDPFRQRHLRRYPRRAGHLRQAGTAGHRPTLAAGHTALAAAGRCARRRRYPLAARHRRR